jgi:plasmid stabilization system protein ParE
MREIYRYIADELQNPVAAARRVELIDAAIRTLEKDPARFPLVRDDYLAAKGYRMVVVKNHLVFFIVREDVEFVSVMRVIYGRRDWMRLLKIEEFESTNTP